MSNTAADANAALADEIEALRQAGSMMAEISVVLTEQVHELHSRIAMQAIQESERREVLMSENAALRELNDKLHAQLAEDTARWSGKAFAAVEQVRVLREALNSTKPWLTPITPKRVAEAICAALEATR